MPSTTLNVKYAPCRIGFLVQKDDIENLVKIAEINSLLWGGILNPIIPVGGDDSFTENLIRSFDLDLLAPIGNSEESVIVLQKHRRLLDYSNKNAPFLYDLHNPNNGLAYLDIINLIDFLWSTEFKFLPEKNKSNFSLLEWEEKDPLSPLFSIIFGRYQNAFNLGRDFRKSFLEGLNGKILTINSKTNISSKINDVISPLQLTSIKLSLQNLLWTRQGLFIGDPKSFIDLCMFWNLRASGRRIAFLPAENIGIFKEYTNAFIASLKLGVAGRNPLTERLDIYYSALPQESVIEELQQLNLLAKVQQIYCSPALWNGLNIIPAKYFIQQQSIIANVDKNASGFQISFATPAKEFIIDKKRTGFQKLLVSITSSSEFSYQPCTLQVPYIDGLQELIGTKIFYDYSMIRIKKEEIGIISRVISDTLQISPILKRELLQAIFKVAGISSELSQAGLITERIIERIGHIDGGRIFRIKGVRDLIKGMKSDNSITRSTAVKRIVAEDGLSSYKKLTINPSQKKLDGNEVFDILLQLDVFRAGLDLQCNYCNLSNWLSLKNIDDMWQCQYCGQQNKTSMHLRSRGDWKFRKSGLFSKDNNQEGAIPTILTLGQLFHIFNGFDLHFCTSLELHFGSSNVEIDFAIINLIGGATFELGFGECKSDGGEIDEKDISNFQRVRDQFLKRKINSYLIFSKTADSFTLKEKELFLNLITSEVPFILFNRKMLEPLPMWMDPKLNSPHQYPGSLQELAENSVFSLQN